MSVELDYITFHKRARLLINSFQSAKASEFAQSDALLFVVGSPDDEASYNKTNALQTWLLGYEFPDTLMAITDSTIIFVCSQKKGTILEGLLKGERQVPIQIFKRSKDEAFNATLFTQVFDLLRKSGSGNKLGSILKDNYQGKFINEFEFEFKKVETQFERVDVSMGIASVLSIKDDEEIKTVKQACKLSSLLINDYFVEEMQNILDRDSKVSHEKLTSMVESKLLDEKSRIKVGADINLDLADWCYPPIIQSGGKYDLKPSASSNSDKLHGGTILCSLGTRYKSYCSNVSRSFLVNPDKQQEEDYKFLLSLYEYLLESLRPEITCAQVYAKAIAFIEKKRPNLKENFVKNCGFSMGIEFRESHYLLGPKSQKPLKPGMILNLCIGFNNLQVKSAQDPKSKVYALLIADTIQMTSNTPIVLTNCDKELSSISYMLGDQEDEDEEMQDRDIKSNQENIRKQVPSKRTAILDSRRRDDSERASEEEKRRAHQALLSQQKQEEGLARFLVGKKQEAAPKVSIRKFESYRKDAPLPKGIVDCKILVDKRAESLILPIFGQAVPFHLSTLKNVTKSDEQDYTLLRFNFITPGVTIGKKDSTTFEDSNSTFIRALSFKSSEMYRMNELFKEVNDLKKELAKREAERLEMADLVEQDVLMEVKGKRPLRLPEVFVRPQLEGKRRPGDLEIHNNGLRFNVQLKGDSKLDILFSNIKHLFFQPCDGELIVILHIHLKNPIMIGKKKTRDIQFYREVSDASFDETGNRRRRVNYGDEDELAAEQEERKRRVLLNKEFQTFSEKVSELSRGKFDVDVPFRELGFQGVPFRQLTLLQPTTDCLVQLTETPNLVITLGDVEIAHLERVQFGLKNFDLVFVFKDFKRSVVHINSIPMNQLDNVKEWLDSVDISFTEGPVNLSWPQIMKTINDSPADFFNEGGWSFLKTDNEGDETEEESESEFDVSESGSVVSSSEDDSVSSAVSETDSDDFSGSEASASESEEGEDWDELERKAAQADAKKRAKDEEMGGPVKKRR